MTAPVDLTNLRSMTDGDADMEKALFEEFSLAFEAGIQVLQVTISSDNEAWRKESHALKGIALNLGADRLGDLCKHAQENLAAGVDNKQIMLEKIKNEYRQVKVFLRALP